MAQVGVKDTGLPSGTVTFLFTDIERSTQTAAFLGDQRYAELLDDHRRLLRSAVAAHSGHEVDTEGDAFFVAFESAGDAVAAAIEAQRAIEGFDWPGEARIRVRMGLHTGEALVRAGDYVGHDVHKAKRICDAGHGGQVLLSQTTADLIAKQTPLVDLGHHRLKDLGEPERIFQLKAEALPESFPPLRSIETFTHNLPTQRTSFVGRAAELAQVQKMLEEERLVTLTGVGGVGKTRLAIQVGAELLDAFPDGVFFIDLAPIAEPDAVAQVIAKSAGLGVSVELGAGAQGATDDRVIAHFADRTSLVILDNCEHLLDACADLADRMLNSCPNVTILATSREALDIEGEQAWRLPSLSVTDPDQVQDSEAVSLFKARARGVRADFDLTPSNVGEVVEICRRLDGIPLAIELAASRVSHMSPHEIATRLGDMFQLLAGGRRRRVQRQQTLQAALDWSYDLLTDEERILLRRLAVFSGSFRFDAVEGICASDGIVSAQILDLLGSLVAKSLVSIEQVRQDTRYRLMETVRLYATEKLHEAQEADRFRARHADWYREWIMSLPDLLLDAPRQLELATEYPNFSVALERFKDTGQLDVVLRMATRLMAVFVNYGYIEDGYRWLSIARPEDLDISREERSSVLSQLSFLVNVLQLPGSSFELAERAIAAAEGEPTPYASRAYVQRAYALAIRSEATRDPELAAEARRDAEEAARLIELQPNVGNRQKVESRNARAMVELILGDYEAANAAVEDVSDQRMDLYIVHLTAAVAAHLAGAHPRAADLGRRAFESVVSARARRGEGRLGVAGLEYGTLPIVAIAGAGRLDEAHSMYRDAFDVAVSSGQRQGLESSILVGAALAYLEGDYPRASRLLSWVRSRTLDQGLILDNPWSYAIYKGYARLLREKLPRDEALRYRSEGAELSEEEAISLALQTERGLVANRRDQSR